MKLELNILSIKEVRFGERTTVRQQVLHVNREELGNLLKEDARLSEIGIELANHGEKCRIFRVIDVIEPRAKTGESGPDFPGALGLQGTAGQGSTCVLRNAAVVLIDQLQSDQPAGLKETGDIIDMSGIAAETSPYGQTCNVVIQPHSASGVSLQDYKIAAKLAGLKTAVYLAKAVAKMKPDDVEIYELPPVAETGGELPALPRVVYIFQILTNQFKPIPGEPVLYGDDVEKIVPTILHPNEVLDGAITTPDKSIFVETYLIQNHPMIKELYRNHGKTLQFAGVIITNAPNNVPEYERTANVAANLAKHILAADGAILTKTGGGAPELVMARTAQRCEELGIKTAIALMHIGIDTTDISPKPSVIFDMPRVDTMVSMGALVGTIKLPPVERIIGVPANVEAPQLSGEIITGMIRVRGLMSQLGNSRLTAVRY